MAGRFELYTDPGDTFRIRLAAGDDETIPVGEACESTAGAINAIESIRKSASVVDGTT